ncbi:hypothetical protein CKM354_001146100 [Cercospora kikuchii]|uniref:Mtf2-like C-terminal domain-containing protein n=1 Tax=Cercospora kikuchii TaxID=84275 RepID=A0A9P3CPK1_9PEZI|nr:uncharacterized protein CKM354_001146100 [Cercospora kikuchii]GIZ48399.1 hypothetical protein CKM354_001146100 [Cercospora kikuchii]
MLAARASHRLSIAECAHGTLLPFLYQTKTIARAYSEELHLDQKAGQGAEEGRKLREIKERWSRRRSVTTHDDGQSATRVHERWEPISQRMQNVARRPKKSQSIPFEGNTGSATPSERLQNTTMTPREMQVFEQLFRKGIGKETVEEQAQDKAKKASKTSAGVEFPDLLKPLVEEAEQLRRQSTLDKNGMETMGELAKPLEELEIKDAQGLAIKDRMDKAASDVECWKVLREHVLDRLANESDHNAMQTSFPALPGLLLHHMRLHADKLPATHSLGLVVLPELKKIGPLAFALGATTELYNQHMQLLWRQYRDLDEIDNVLAEMDREVYSFNEGTQDLLAAILDHADDALSGRLGPTARALWTMDRKSRGLAKLKEWKKAVDQRLREQALSDVQALQADLDDDA